VLLSITCAIGLSACALPGLELADYERAPDRFATSHDALYVDEDAVEYQPVVHPITPELVINLSRAESIEAIPAVDSSPEAGFEYRVGPGDILGVVVFEHPELTNPTGLTEAQSLVRTGQLVHPDGTMFFPYVGTIKVAGRTVRRIRQMLTDGLKRVIAKPQVDVRVLSFRSKFAFVVGSVGRPCRIAITDRPLTIVDALNQCKSIIKQLVTRNITLVRGGRPRAVDLREVYLGKNPFGRRLRAGDRIYVNDTFDRVFMVGEFQKQKTVPIPTSGLSLSEAIASAGGLDLETADPGNVYVIRGLVEQDLEGKTHISPDIYHLDADSIDALILADQLNLQPRDIVFAAAAGFVNFNRAIAQILPTVSLLFQSRFILEGY
jgi:polysaccharide export outer membrane protein